MLGLLGNDHTWKLLNQKDVIKKRNEQLLTNESRLTGKFKH